MQIAVISDIHDNIWNLEKALKIVQKRKIDTAIFCGDYCAPTSFKMATEGFKKAYCIWGNVDGEKFVITREIYKNKINSVELLGDFGDVELGDRRVAIIHNPDIALVIAKSTLFDVVFFGHLHKPSVEKIGKTLLVNPGEIMGKNGKPSFGVWNSEENEMEIVRV